MEIIIFIAVVVVAALLWSGYVKTKKTESDQIIDSWQPPKAEDKPWPYGEKLAEGKIHTKVTDYADIAIAQIKTPPVAAVAPGKSADDRVEAPAPVVESVPAKKPAAKKTAAKPAAAKKPAVKKATTKKSST
jgi:hypothetical protein